MQYFTLCDEKDPDYRIIELIFYCFLTNRGIKFLVQKLNYLIKNVSLIQYKDFVPIYPYLISEGDEMFRACDRHWDETATLTKHVTKYKYIIKWMVEFLSKSQSRVIKIARVKSIRMTKLSIYFNFLCAVPRDDVIESTRFLMRPPVIVLLSPGLSYQVSQYTSPTHPSNRPHWRRQYTTYVPRQQLLLDTSRCDSANNKKYTYFPYSHWRTWKKLTTSQEKYQGTAKNHVQAKVTRVWLDKFRIKFWFL